MDVNSGTAPLAQCLSMISVSADLMAWLRSKEDLWASFGKMNSHQYRKDLMRRFMAAELTGQEQFMVYFLFSIIKNKDRVLKALDNMEAEDRNQAWFRNVRAFVDSNVTQYVSDVTRSKKFPAVNIPVTNPGMDILCWMIHSPVEDHTVTNASYRTTFTQLNLDEQMQTLAQIGYKAFWDSTVMRTKNPDAKSDANFEKPEYKEEYYLTSAADKYPLIFVDMQVWTGLIDMNSLMLWMDLVDLYLGKKSPLEIVLSDGLLPSGIAFPTVEEFEAVGVNGRMYSEEDHRITRLFTATGVMPDPLTENIPAASKESITRRLDNLVKTVVPEARLLTAEAAESSTSENNETAE